MPLTYLSVAEARDLPGLRLVLTAHVPGPWGEAAKAVFKLRNVPYAPVAQIAMQPNEELVAWTGIRNAPVAVFEDEAPRSGWLEILLLAERLGSGPSLLPDDPIERALSLGFSTEICGPEGLLWSRRLGMFGAAGSGSGPQNPILTGYGLRPDTAAKAPARVVSILGGLTEQLRRQRAAGSEYLVGSSLSACDVSWACFSVAFDPPPHDLCPMPPQVRETYSSSTPELAAALDPELIKHRDMVFQRHIGLPLVF